MLLFFVKFKPFAAVVLAVLLLGLCGCAPQQKSLSSTFFPSSLFYSLNSTAFSSGGATSEFSQEQLTAFSSVIEQQSSALSKGSETVQNSSAPASFKGSGASSAISSSAAETKIGFLKGVWISCYDYSSLGLQNLSEAAARQLFLKMMKTVHDAGYNTVFCHVRAFGDAYYPSKYFPFSASLTGVSGKNPGYDPLALMLSAAKAYGLQFHAWLNPYRVRLEENKPALSEKDPAKKWLEDGSDRVVSAKGGLYYNPGSADVRRLLLNGVEEILKNYKVDGIHFDDYFYPVTTPEFDRKAYEASGKKTTLENWRRNNVNILISQTWRLCQKYHVTFGVSPSGHLPDGKTDVNYTTQYADLCLWLSTPGYVDYLAPQLYWGFEYSKPNFCYATLLKEWCGLKQDDRVQLYIGLAGYKIGSTSPEEQTDFQSGNLLARQVTAAAEQKVAGIINFSYRDLISEEPFHVKENSALKPVLKSLK